MSTTFSDNQSLASYLLDTLFGGVQPEESVSVIDAVQMERVEYPIERDSDEYDYTQRAVWETVTNGSPWPF